MEKQINKQLLDRVKEHTELIKTINSGLHTVKEHTALIVIINEELNTLNKKVDKILNISLNGFIPVEGKSNLETSLKLMYETGLEARISKAFWRSFAEWRKQTAIFKICNTKFGRVILFLLLIILVNSLMISLFGFDLDLQSIFSWFKLLR